MTGNRDDDSLVAAQVDIDGAKDRIKKLEEMLASPDKVGKLLSEAVANSSVLRKSLSASILELMDDHDTRSELKKILSKIDREFFWRWGKYILAALAWIGTVAGGIAIFK